MLNTVAIVHAGDSTLQQSDNCDKVTVLETSLVSVFVNHGSIGDRLHH